MSADTCFLFSFFRAYVVSPSPSLRTTWPDYYHKRWSRYGGRIFNTREPHGLTG
jgi:hypothetical protein